MATAVALAILASAVRLPQLLVGRAGAGQIQWQWGYWWLEFWFTLPKLAGFAVLVAWAALALGGNERGARSWLDRFGIALGIGWIAMAVLDLAASWVSCHAVLKRRQ